MKRAQEIINAKCKLLKSLGFTIDHEDLRVSYHDVGVEFDFSATACDIPSLIYTAMNAMYQNGYDDGTVSVQKQIKSALGIYYE